MLDFTQPAGGRSEGLSNEISALLDAAIVAEKKRVYEAGRGSGVGDVAKHRIGSGYVGLECTRELAYRYFKAPKEEREGPVAPGELARHGEAGHWTETKTAEWLRLAGFQILTEREPGKQYGYLAARDANGQARLAGELDGVIIGVPPGFSLPIIKPPCAWESKKATAKKWKKFKSKGVAEADPQYYGQVQINMAYMGLEQTLFSMLNLDDMKYYWELIFFDLRLAQMLSDRAVRVFESGSPEEHPRIARERGDFRCKFCDFQGRCWSTPEPPKTGLTFPAPWLTPA